MNFPTSVLTRWDAGARAALLAVSVLALSLPAFAAGAPADAWTTTKVKVALATGGDVNAAEVHVDTVRRQVTLHGTVATAVEKEAAGRTAEAVEGVEAVRNLLQVVPARDEVAVAEKDDDVHQRVTAALAADASLRDSSIAVQSVNKGLVLLKGDARTVSDHLTAIEVARAVPGVRRVASQVQSEDALADEDIWKEPNIAVGGGGSPTPPGAAADLYTTSKVKMGLLANAETPAMEINVDTRAGVVTLFGMVPTAASKAAAEAQAVKTGGVVSVKNQLQVVAVASQPAVEAKDDVIQKDVARNLGESAAFSKVSCEVKNCVARLTGSVSTGLDRVEAMQIARGTKGVCSVKDDLTVE
ncbi:MAG: BON domain-containing protein [Candidatus Binatia bacterium]